MFKDLVDFSLPVNEDRIISVIGVGGGGCNAVNRMYREGIRDVDFVVLNTDKLALDASPVEKKIQLGATLTDGKGAGNRSDVGEQAAIESMGDILDALAGSTKMAFIVAGMGKGTGTGAAPIVARACKELNILTVGVVTLPFSIEGPSRKLQALQGINRLKGEVDALLIISNEKLREIYGNLSLGEAFKKADDILTLAVKGIAEIITLHGYINVDFADVQSVMTGGGIAFMGSATASGSERAQTVIEQTINSPLLNSNDIRGAERVLLNITSGLDEVTVDELGVITDRIRDRVGRMVNVIWGTCTDETLENDIRITLIATGFSDESIPDWISLNPPVKKTVRLEQESPPAPVRGTTATTDPFPSTAPRQVASPPLEKHPEPKPESTENREAKNQIAPDRPTIPGKPQADRLQEFNYWNLSNPDLIDEVERIPAYKRRGASFQAGTLFSEEETQSRLTIGTDARIRPNNPFLHDVVD
ncbi:MAG: cell division protein FtsZ [Bacteroidales bacterium]